MNEDHDAYDPERRPRPWRFVAGAACPLCGAEDRLQIRTIPASAQSPEGGLQRRCVECDFQDEQTSGDASPAVPASVPVTELTGKLGAADLLDEMESPVRLIDPRKPS